MDQSKSNLKITLRPATINDLALLKHWDQQQHVIDSDPDDDWNWEIELKKTPAWREQLVAERNGKPIGFIQIIDPKLEETHYWGNVSANQRAIDIWIGEKYNLGKGYGTEMMTMAIQRCFSHAEVNTILIDPLESNIRAIRFYQRLGFQFVEYRAFENSKCAVHQLTREDWNDFISRSNSAIK